MDRSGDPFGVCAQHVHTPMTFVVYFTGRMICPRKRGVIKVTEPRELTKLVLNPKHWGAKLKG